MEKNKFYNIGTYIYPLRWYIIAAWILILICCTPFLPNIISPFKTTGFIDDRSKSAKIEQYIDDSLGYNKDNKFIIMYHSNTLLADSSLYAKKIKQSLAQLKDFPVQHVIFYPKNNKKQISKDKHTAYVAVFIKSKTPLSEQLLAKFKALIITPPNMTLQLGGELIFTENLNKQTQDDLYAADFIATPVAIITLILIFGSIVAASIPIFLGGGCALIILTSLYFLGHLFTLSVFTLNIALLLGLCISLDYCLFIICRFRDELYKNRPIKEAIAITQATAGKAIFYSGLAVFASLSGLLLFPINILFSVAVGGLVAVFVAVFTATIVLPAILSTLGLNINRLSVRHLQKKENPRYNGWHWIATHVVSRPLLCFISILIVLLMLGYPFLSTRFGISDFHIFPEHSESRRFFDTYSEKFNQNELTPIIMMMNAHSHSILSYQNISDLYKVTHKLKRNPLIAEVNSIVTTNNDLTKLQYYKLYNVRTSLMNKNIHQLLETTTGKHFTVINIISHFPIDSPETTTLIHDLRHLSAGKQLDIELAGSPIDNRDVLKTITDILPYAVLWIVTFTYLILLLLLRSVFLPIKAILMNLLSISACFGALVLVFQEGYLHQFLNFEPQGMLDISLLVIIFCAIFGFSMDYEVFLLSRIKEAYESTHDNNQSIIYGIEKSSRIITSAAIIVICLCSSFLVADVLMVKAFGLGIAVAIFVDAFLIRTILVPATMALIKEWNWYSPKWLQRLLPKC